MSVATMTTTISQHLDHCHHTSLASFSTAATKQTPHPYEHRYHRRRFGSPISPLSATYNTHFLNATKDGVIAACDRELHWSFEEEYGRVVETYMKCSEVKFRPCFATDKKEYCLPSAEMMDLQTELE